MRNILKNKPLFKLLHGIFAGTIFLFLLFGRPLWLGAMTEEEYVSMAAESMILLHQAGGNPQAMQKAAEDFLNKFPQEKVEEYIMMARQIMQDSALAQRISEKVIQQLSARGYNIESFKEDHPGSMKLEP